MRRLDACVVFPPRYAHTADGLGAAERRLARLVAIHTAYANQPNISKIWQGYIDKQADAVDMQRAIVEALQGIIVPPPMMTSLASPRPVGGHRSDARI